MSTPLAKDDRIDEALLYTPPWVRQAPRPTPRPDDERPPLTRARPDRSTEEPTMPMGIGGPNIELPARLRQPNTFSGDVAMVELRRRLSLQPDVVPEPPILTYREPPERWLTRLSFVLLMAAVSAYGLTMLSAGQIDPRPTPLAANAPTPRLTVKGPKEPMATPARLVVESRRAFANEPLALGLALAGASGEEFVLLKGLSNGTRLSAGAELAPRNWRVSAGDLGSLSAFAPRDYIGTMDAAVDLHAGNRLVDSQVIRLEWVENAQAKSASLPPAQAAAHPAHPSLDPQEIAMLIDRGQTLLRSGNISSARLLLRRAAHGGSAEAAFVLGGSFDPAVLAEIGVLGFAPDPEQARVWYAKATELGWSDAARRLERLSKADAR